MRKASFVVLYLVWFASLGNLQAQTFEEKYGKMVTDDAARESIALALSKIHTAKCDGGKPCAPATSAELSSPPITTNDARIAMVTAIKSALAQWCGLNALRSFLPAISTWDGRKKSQRQLQLFSLVHSDFMSRQLAYYQMQAACPATLRAQLDQQLPKSPY